MIDFQLSINISFRTYKLIYGTIYGTMESSKKNKKKIRINVVRSKRDPTVIYTVVFPVYSDLRADEISNVLLNMAPKNDFILLDDQDCMTTPNFYSFIDRATYRLIIRPG